VIDAEVPGDRVERLEELARKLTIDDVMALAQAIEQSARYPGPWAPSERYWFSGTGGASLSKAQDRYIRSLWTRVQAGITLAMTGIDLDLDETRSGLRAMLDWLAEPSRDLRIEGRAATLLERRLGRDVWLSVIAVWNAFCAALLSETLEPSWQVTLRPLSEGRTYQTVEPDGRIKGPGRTPQPVRDGTRPICVS
jgi:hypothetical protein